MVQRGYLPPERGEEQGVFLISLARSSGAHGARKGKSHMAKKHQLPKKLLGVKVPKPLRNFDWLTSFLESDIGRRIIAEALVAAAAAASAALIAPRTETGAKAGKAVQKTGRNGGHLVQDVVRSAASAATGVIGNAAKSMLSGTEEDKRRRNTAH